MAVKSYRDLTVWQRAMELVVECYGLATKLPRDERFGLTSQLQRAAVAIPANIAEGHGRARTQAYINHLSIAAGSITELQTLIEIAARLQYVTRTDVKTAYGLSTEVARMLSALQTALRRRRPRPEE
jgi:four helix bundle protein